MPRTLTGCIQVSSSTWALLEGEPLEGEMLEYSGGIDVKGKGMMDTYLWAPLPQGSAAEAATAAASGDRLSVQGQRPQLPHVTRPKPQQQHPPADNILLSS